MSGNATSLEQTIIEGIIGAIERAYVPARLGKVNEDGSISLLVKGKPNHVWVRLGLEGELGPTIARNEGIPLVAHLPVRMLQIRGEWVVKQADHTGGRLEEFWGGQRIPSGSVPYHVHKIGSGLEYEIEALRLEPGRVRWQSGMTVYLGPFRYRKPDSTWDTWEGGTLDLTSYKPVTTGHHAWVLVGVNPATNAAVAVAGTSQAYATPLTVAQIDAINFQDYIPLAAIQVRNDDTTLKSIGKYQDARGWLNNGKDGLTEAEANLLYVRQDGTTPLTGDWDIGEDRKIKAEILQARDAEGLSILGPNGEIGLFVENGGQVGIGTLSPSYPTHFRYSAPNVLRITGHKDGGSFASSDVIAELHFDAEDADTLGSTVDANAVIRAISRGAQSSSGKDTDLAFLVKGVSGNYNQADIEVMRLTAEGRIGIGMTNPTYHVHVANDSSSHMAIRRAASNVFGPNFIVEKARGSISSPTAVSANDLLGAIRYAYYNGSSWVNSASIQGYMETASTTGIAFFTAAETGISDAKMRLTAGGDLGIGGAPSHRIHAISSTIASLGLQSTGTSGIHWQIATADSSSAPSGASASALFFRNVTNNIVRMHLTQSGWLTVIGPMYNTDSDTIAEFIAQSGGLTSGTRLRVASSGKIYAQGVYDFTVGATNRDVFVDNTGQLGYVSSTRRHKKNIQPLLDLSWLYRLRPVYFIRKDDPAETPEMGLIAEEVAEVAPHLVSRGQDGEPETVRYSQLIPALLAAVQQQVKQIEQLARRVLDLEEQVKCQTLPRC